MLSEAAKTLAILAINQAKTAEAAFAAAVNHVPLAFGEPERQAPKLDALGLC